MSDSLVLNKSAILESMGEDEELFAETAQMYIDESPKYCQKLRLAVSNNDAQSLRLEAHILKSLLATFADEDGRQLAITVEKQAKNGEVDAEKIQQLDARIQLLAQVLQNALN